MPAHAPQFQLTGIDHIVLRVRDLARALAFYRDVLGCSLEREQRELGLTQLRAGRSLIDLVTADGPLGARLARSEANGPNLEHFCLSLVPFEERSLAAHLAAHGIQLGEGAVRYGAEGESRSFYVDDPDGNRVELKGARAPP